MRVPRFSLSVKGVNTMANIKSAKKRINIIAKKTARNRRVKAHLKTIVKNFDAAVTEGNLDAAKEKLTLAGKRFMQAAAKGTIHKNAASRKISRITKKFNQANV
jgi:small subunit ribosomal protein S20